MIDPTDEHRINLLQIYRNHFKNIKNGNFLKLPLIHSSKLYHEESFDKGCQSYDNLKILLKEYLIDKEISMEKLNAITRNLKRGERHLLEKITFMSGIFQSFILTIALFTFITTLGIKLDKSLIIYGVIPAMLTFFAISSFFDLAHKKTIIQQSKHLRLELGILKKDLTPSDDKPCESSLEYPCEEECNV